VVASNSFFRLGFATYLIEAVCDVALALLFYFLLKPVQRHVALLAAFFGLVSTALYAVAELFYFFPTVIYRSSAVLKSYSPQQLNELALLSFKLFATGGEIFMVFYGIATFLRGFLIFRSTYLPRFLGVLVMLAGVGFMAKNFVLVLAPSYASDFFLLPMFVAGIALTGWFLIKGIDVEKWRERASNSQFP
jgi:hypothetical protein